MPVNDLGMGVAFDVDNNDHVKTISDAEMVHIGALWERKRRRSSRRLIQLRKLQRASAEPPPSIKAVAKATAAAKAIEKAAEKEANRVAKIERQRWK